MTVFYGGLFLCTVSFKYVLTLSYLFMCRYHYPGSAFGVRTTALSAEWEPTEGMKWTETNFEADIAKIEQEAEKRLDAKIEELEANIASVGKA